LGILIGIIFILLNVFDVELERYVSTSPIMLGNG